MRYLKHIGFGVLFLLIAQNITSQPFIVDQIVAVVGKSTIQHSDIEEQFFQAKMQRQEIPRCQILEDLLAQKLLVTQAGVDSIEVAEGEVELELEQRILYFINQIGSEEKLVKHFGKSVLEIKDDMRDIIHDQMLMQRMQSEIVSDMTITPAEVKDFYKSLHRDSIPNIDSEIEVNQIVLYPKSSEEEIFKVREKLLNIRKRIMDGDRFATMAVLYSEGPSSTKGGDIGWATKADLDPAYTKAALALKVGQVSKIVESSFGYHLIMLTDKSGDRFKTSHILMKPKINIEEKTRAIERLDSIATIIRTDTATFEQAAMYFSDDEDTRLNGGLRVNPMTQTSKFRVDEFSPSEYYIIRNLSIGEISDPFESVNDKSRVIYKIIQLKSRTNPHKANLKDDYLLLKNMALQDKQSKVIDEWVQDKAKDTYIRISPEFINCEFRLNVWNN